jgi:molecular chaperone DnaK
MIFQTDKQLKEYGEKIPAEKKSVIEKAAEKLKGSTQSAESC